MTGVRTERRGAVLEITLDRPKANAVDAATSRVLGAAFMELRDDPKLRVGLVTGAGERFFSAGWDLAAAEEDGPDPDYGPGGFMGLTELFDLHKPVVGAINGMAVGGGFELALACDLVVAADHAEFFLSEIAIGIVADAGGVLRLPRRIPRAVAIVRPGCNAARRSGGAGESAPPAGLAGPVSYRRPPPPRPPPHRYRGSANTRRTIGSKNSTGRES